MKKNKFLSLLIALILAVQLLPLSVFAEEEEATEYVESVETLYASSSSDEDNDELLEGYIEQLFGISDNSGIMLTATYTGEDAFANIPFALEIYTQVKAGIEKIASGEETSSIVTFTHSYTYAELGADNFYDAYPVVSNQYLSYSELIYDYLLSDCPYELYWHDKETGAGFGVSYSGNSTTLYATFKVTFAVASGYQGSDSTTVDSSMVVTAKAAAAYAQTIVDTYASCTDLEKITAYKTEICNLVSYESSYTTADYGDIWQLVYVFDQDTTTNVVCEGYSKAFQYLCDLSGLYSITVTGTMSGGTGAGGHMWNVVWLDGINYLVDVTNSDSGTVGQNGGLFMVCEDEATAIYEDDESNVYGYAFYAGGKTITYIYYDTTLSLYDYEEYLALGSRFLGKSLTLDGEIGVTYYFNLSGVEDPSAYYLSVSVDGVTDKVYADGETKEVKGYTYYRYIVYVSPTQLTSTITASLKSSSGTLVSLDNYSVYQYCEAAITSDSTSDLYEVKDLCAAVLNYGYYVETWLNGSSSINIQNDIDSSWDDPVDDTWDVDLSSYGNTATTGVTKSLALDGTGIYIRVYGIDTSKTYTVSGKEVTTGNDGSDYIEFKVPAKEMSSTFTILEDGVTFTTYSVYSYIKNTIETSSDEDLVNVCKAIYYYGQASAAYQGWR
ncbi:MAG: hypothetical protein LUF29_00580 [Oscillospiraceae bacterium]|nr:hypothetical protein [Oscillospiraceae bacterium]